MWGFWGKPPKANASVLEGKLSLFPLSGPAAAVLSLLVLMLGLGGLMFSPG